MLIDKLYSNDVQMIKKQENVLNDDQIVKLYAIRFIHYFFVIIILVYPFLIKYKLIYDIFYLLIIFVIIVHRYILSECILSIIEKQILDPYYKIGSNILYEPFLLLIGLNYNVNNIKIIHYLIFFFVLFRVLRSFM